MIKDPGTMFILAPSNKFFTLSAPTMRMEGLYRLQVRSKSDNRLLRDTGWFKNIITDIGLDRIGTTSAVDRMQIGTGTTPPAVTDTGLANLSATTTTIQSIGTGNLGAPGYIATYSFVYRFNAGQLNGNYSEVGIGWSGGLWSRALILDGGGSPTTISVGLTEYLDVAYQVRIIPDLSDYVSSVVISGTTYSVTRRPAFVSTATIWRPTINSRCTWSTSGGTYSGSFNGTIGAVTGGPSGSGNQTDSVTASGYVNNSLENGGTAFWGLNVANQAPGVKSVIICGSYCAYQHEFAPVLPKNATKQLTLTGKVSWGRV